MIRREMGGRQEEERRKRGTEGKMKAYEKSGRTEGVLKRGKW